MFSAGDLAVRSVVAGIRHRPRPNPQSPLKYRVWRVSPTLRFTTLGDYVGCDA